jgi:hypothetical protein
MEKIKVNTDASEFKIITDKKDEPRYKEVSKFVGGMVSTFTADKYAFGSDDFVVGPAILIKAKALSHWAA